MAEHYEILALEEEALGREYPLLDGNKPVREAS